MFTLQYAVNLYVQLYLFYLNKVFFDSILRNKSLIIYILRNSLPFYPELQSSRYSYANPKFRLSRCYNDLSQKLENPLDFSLNISKVSILIKMLSLVYK